MAGRIGIFEAVPRIERAIAQALANHPSGRGFVGASARLQIGLLDEGLPAPRPSRSLVHVEGVDAVVIDAIEPTEAMPAVAVPVELEFDEQLEDWADAPGIAGKDLTNIGGTTRE